MITYKRDFSKNKELYNAYLDSLAVEAKIHNTLISKLQDFVDNPNEVADSLKMLSKRLSPEGCIDSYDLAKIIYLESRFNAQAQNDSTGATGLIQLLPSVISRFGWDYISIFNSSPLKQLKYAEVYIRFWLKEADRITKGKNIWKNGAYIRNVSDLYLIIHYPRSFVYKDSILYKLGSKAYAYNSGLDTNNDYVVDRSDIFDRLNKTPFN